MYTWERKEAAEAAVDTAVRGQTPATLEAAEQAVHALEKDGWGRMAQSLKKKLAPVAGHIRCGALLRRAREAVEVARAAPSTERIAAARLAIRSLTEPSDYVPHWLAELDALETAL